MLPVALSISSAGDITEPFMWTFCLSHSSILEDKLGPGHQQIVLGLLIFASGALWGIMLASGDGDIDLADLYVSAVVMLSGAMITLLGISFGSGNELDETSDLKDTITELTSMLEKLQQKVLGKEEE